MMQPGHRTAPYYPSSGGGAAYLGKYAGGPGSTQENSDGKLRSTPPAMNFPPPRSMSTSSITSIHPCTSDIPSQFSRVVPSTPSTFCSKCGATRIDIRFKCCGAGYHARCVYPWPCTSCPSCRRPVAGMEILPLEPFSRNGELVQVSERVAAQTRGGRWSDAELKFAEAVIEGFMMGVLPIREGTRLGTLLCNLLQCTSARLSSKLKTGKKCFKYTMSPTQGEMVKCDKLQRELSEKEELFLYYLSPEDAAATSQRLQMEWRAHFIDVAQRVGQEIENLDAWTAVLKDYSPQEAGGLKGDGPDVPRLGGVQHQNLRGLASMLVRMAVDRRQGYTPRQVSGPAALTFDDLLQHLSAGPPDELALLARAHHGSVLFASAGLKATLQLEDSDILGAWLNRPSGLLHRDDVPLLEQLCRQSQVDVRSLIDKLGSPQVGVTDGDVTLRSAPLRLQARGGMFLEQRFVVVCTDDFLLLHGQKSELVQHPLPVSRPTPTEHQIEMAGGSHAGEGGAATAAGSDAMDGPEAPLDDIRKIDAIMPDDMSMQDLDDDMDVHGMDFLDSLPSSFHQALIPVSTEGLRGGAGPSAQANNACGGAYDLYYSPPASFEQTMRSFLRDVPFEAVDIWVPMTDSGGRLWLQFGGGLAMRPDLYDWVYYSRAFCFYEGEGMPGRVFRSQQTEYQDDIALLDRNLFLRRDGALANGVRTCFGVPICQGRNVFVLVFYASRAIHMAKEVQDYIRQQISTWRIEATALGNQGPQVPSLPLQEEDAIPCIAPASWTSDTSSTSTTWSTV